MRNAFHSSIQYCAAIVRPGPCGYCAATTPSKWYDIDLHLLVCPECFNHALDAERELAAANLAMPPASLCVANP